MNKRISSLIENLQIKKIDFAKTIKVSAPFVSELCSGAKLPSNRTISDICREFNVNEDWLRTGEGEMFIQRSRHEELADFFGDVLSGQTDFRFRLISALSRMTTEQWEALEQVAVNLMDEIKKPTCKWSAQEVLIGSSVEQIGTRFLIIL